MRTLYFVLSAVMVLFMSASSAFAQRRTNVPVYDYPGMPETFRERMRAQEAVFDGLVPQVSESYVYFEEMVPSGEDGIRLLTRIYLPEGEGPFPVVVTRTPYVMFEDDCIAAGRAYARHGIGYIQQDCRGKGGSEGFFSPNVNERADGIALYRWLDEQPWCGDIGIFGSSYTALTGWLVGDSVPDKVKGMYLSHYGVDRHISCYRSGLFREDIMSGWAIDNAEEDIVKPERKPGQAPGENYYDFYLYRPQVEADVNILGCKLQYYRDWITHTDYDDPYWNTGVWADLKRIPPLIDVPMTIVAGQFDHHEEGTVLGYERLSPEVKSCSRLVLGSWNHSFEVTPTHVPAEHAKEFNITTDQFLWFYSLLVRKEDPKPEVLVYNIEADEWEEFDSWPIRPDSTRTMYLSSEQAGQKWNVLALLQSGQGTESEVGYVYDPLNPVYAEGGETLFTSSQRRGSRLQSEPGYRDDVLSFVSAPLEADMTIAGNVKVYLKVSTDVDDTAFAFTLSEVTPEGKAYNMRTSIATLGYRNGLLEPRVKYEKGSEVVLEIEALPILWTVRAGNALRLDIKSSQFPEYAVHSNTEGVWSEQAVTVKANQKVYVGGPEGSRIVFPVLN